MTTMVQSFGISIFCRKGSILRLVILVAELFLEVVVAVALRAVQVALAVRLDEASGPLAFQNAHQGVGDSFFAVTLRFHVTIAGRHHDCSIAAHAVFLGQSGLAIGVNVFHLHAVRG